jgi:hypothetical protein
MKSFLKLFILIICLLFPVIAFAQDATPTQAVDLSNGYSISLPLGWTLLRGSGGAFTARGSGLSLKIFTPTYVDTLDTNISADSNVVDALITLYALPPTSATVAKADVLKSRYGDRLAAVYADVSDDATDQMAIVISMPTGSPGYLIFSADKGQLVGMMDILTPIVGSFIQTEAATEEAPTQHGASVGGASSAGGNNGATTGGSEVNCTVSAASADAAQLRVGPGTNRGAISFLPANIDVTVTGRIVLSDKSVWFQLDKTEAAPKGTAAAELWVAADQVTATGDCDHVGETSAPPVIPGHVAPPTAVPGSTNQPPPDQGSADGASGTLPRAGTWTLTFNSTTNASCQGYENVPIPSTEIFDNLTQTYSMFIINSNSFNYGNDVFTRIPGTNSFNGSFTFDDGTNAQIRFDMTSATSMFGQAVTNFTQDGVACSATALFLTNHR